MARRPNPCKLRHFAAPDDGRPLEEIRLGELQPWPAMDAAAAIERAMQRVKSDRKQ